MPKGCGSCRAALATVVGCTALGAASIYWPWLSATVITEPVQVIQGAKRQHLKRISSRAAAAPRAASPPAPAARAHVPPAPRFTTSTPVAPTSPPQLPAPESRRRVPPKKYDEKRTACSDLVLTAEHEKLSGFELELAKADRCGKCYLERMQLLFGTTGADVVLGANDGKRYDPAWWLDYWAKVPLHTKVFVEPVPPIFAKLKNNTASLGNALPLNNAVRSLGQPPHLNLYCWDLEMVDQAVNHGAKPLPKEVRQPKEFWAYLCATDRASVIQAADVLKDIYALPPGMRSSIQKEVERHVVKYPVEALTPKQIFQKVGLSEVRYVQIDVEGLDNEIVKALPLGEEDFWPQVILYENHDGHRVRGLLESKGYYVCCCFNKWGNNMLAVRQ